MITIEQFEKLIQPHLPGTSYPLNVRYDLDKVRYVQSQIINGNFILPEPTERNKVDNVEPFLNYALTTGGFKTVTYACSKEFGRLGSQDGRSYVQLHRPVRHFLCKSMYSDHDIVDCHPVIIGQLLNLFGDSTGYELMKKWSKNREKYFQLLIHRPDGQPSGKTRDDAKCLGYTFLYEGSVNARMAELGFPDPLVNGTSENPKIHKIRSLATSLCRHVVDLRNAIKEKYPDLWKVLPRNEEKPNYREDAGKFSSLIQHIECKIMLVAADVAIKHGFEINDYAHDGLFLSHNLKPATDTDKFYHDAEQTIQSTYGLKVQFAGKDMKIVKEFEGYVCDISMSQNIYSEPKLRDLPSYPRIIMQADYGTGKTYQAIKMILKDKPKTVLWISPRIQFSRGLVNRISAAGLSPELYMDLPRGLIDPEKHPFVIIQINSIHRIPSFKYDMIICDEFESVLSMLSAHILKKRRTCIETLESICKSADRLILGDCNVTDRTWNLLKQWGLNGNQLHFEKNTYTSRSKHARQVGCPENLLFHINESLNNNHKIVIFSSSANFLVEKVIPTIEQEHSDKKYLLYLGGDSRSKAIKSGITVSDITDVEKEWGNPEIRIVMYTSTITVGVDFNIPDVFDDLFVQGVNGCATPREVLQAMHRVRKIRSDHIWFSCAHYPRPSDCLSNITTIRQIKDQLNSRSEIAKLCFKNDDDTSVDYLKEGQTPSWFVALNIWNIYEQALGLNRFEDQLTMYLKMSGYNVIKIYDDREFHPKKNDLTQEEQDGINLYQGITSLDDMEYLEVDYRIKRGINDTGEYLQWLKYQFDNSYDYMWKGHSELFNYMLSPSGRSRLKFVREHLRGLNSSDYIKRKLDEEFIQSMTGRGILLDPARNICTQLGLQTMIDDSPVSVEKFVNPARSVLAMRRAGIINFREDMAKTDVCKVNHFFRYLTGLEFEAIGRRRVNGKIVKVYRLKDTEIFDPDDSDGPVT